MAAILVVDDDPEIAELLRIYLSNEGYAVHAATDGARALALLGEEHVELAILDIMMPGLGGLEVCRKIRERSDIPIIFLSARSHAMDKITGLGAGADDYLAKPFNVMELVARVKSHLRRYLGTVQGAAAGRAADGRGHGHPGRQVTVGELTVDPERHEVRIGERKADLTPKEFDILLLLASNPGRVFSSEEIHRRVWGERGYDSGNTVMVHVRKIRAKIEGDPARPCILKTVWGVGYRVE